MILNAPNSLGMHACTLLDLQEEFTVEGFDSFHLGLLASDEEESDEEEENAYEEECGNDDSDAVVEGYHVDTSNADGYHPRQYHQS